MHSWIFQHMYTCIDTSIYTKYVDRYLRIVFMHSQHRKICIHTYIATHNVIYSNTQRTHTHTYTHTHTHTQCTHQNACILDTGAFNNHSRAEHDHATRCSCVAAACNRNSNSRNEFDGCVACVCVCACVILCVAHMCNWNGGIHMSLMGLLKSCIHAHTHTHTHTHTCSHTHIHTQNLLEFGKTYWSLSLTHTHSLSLSLSLPHTHRSP